MAKPEMSCEWRDEAESLIRKMIKEAKAIPEVKTELQLFIENWKPEPAEPLIVKSGETWVKHENGIDSICLNPKGEKIFHLYKSFTGPNPDIT